MKRFILALGLVLVLAVYVSAQSYKYFGPTTLHRDSVTTSDSWYESDRAQARSEALELSGYDSVRADFDLTGSSISVSLQCSNDSLWFSGDSTAITGDSWAAYDLVGCDDYSFYIGNVDPGESMTIYVTPYND